MTSGIRSDFRATGTALNFNATSDVMTFDVLEIIRPIVLRRPKAVRSIHTERYVRQQLDGSKPMPLAMFIHLLGVVFKLGELKACGQGRDWVRRILQLLAAPFGLDVVLRPDHQPKADVKSAAVEAAGACGEAFSVTSRALADDRITPDEAVQIESAVKRAEAKLEEAVITVHEHKEA